MKPSVRWASTASRESKLALEYDYYPACFSVRPVGEALKKQESEIAEIRYFRLDALPEVFAFEYTQMAKDFAVQEKGKKERNYKFSIW